MFEENDSYLSKLSITEKAERREEQRRNNDGSLPKYTPTPSDRAANLFQPQTIEYRIDADTDELEPAKTYSRAQFLQRLLYYSVGAGTAMLYNSFTTTDEQPDAQTETKDEVLKLLNARAAKLQKDAAEAQKALQFLEDNLLHLVTNNYELNKGGTIQLTGTYIIARSTQGAPFIVNERDGQILTLRPGINIITMQDLCTINIPFTEDGFHIYNLSSLRILLEKQRPNILIKILDELNTRYPQQFWNLNEYSYDEFTSKVLTMDAAEARSIDLQTKNQNCECGPDEALRIMLEHINNQW